VWISGRLPAAAFRQRDANTRRTRVRLAYPHDDSMLAIQVRDAALHSPHRPSPLGGMERASGNAAGGRPRVGYGRGGRFGMYELCRQDCVLV
jgi:hypothetical protein